MKLRLLLIACVLVWAGTASAASMIIDFESGAVADNGMLTWAGGPTPLVGTDIAIANVFGTNTPDNKKPAEFNVCAVAYPCTLTGNGGTDIGGRLDFTTGTFLGFNAVTDTYSWGAGGSIVITGYGPGCTTNGACPGGAANTESGPVLLTGNVVSAQFIDGMLDVALAAGNDVKNTQLLNFFGLGIPSVTGFHFAGTVQAGSPDQPGGPGTAFSAITTGSTDIKNTAVPELSSILLLGTLLSGSANLLRRKLFKR